MFYLRHLFCFGITTRRFVKNSVIKSVLVYVLCENYKIFVKNLQFNKISFEIPKFNEYYKICKNLIGKLVPNSFCVLVDICFILGQLRCGSWKIRVLKVFSLMYCVNFFLKLIYKFCKIQKKVKKNLIGNYVYTKRCSWCHV